MVWLATGLGAFAAGLLQTVTGFGAATVLMLVLPHFFTMTEAAALSSVICMIWQPRWLCASGRIFACG